MFPERCASSDYSVVPWDSFRLNQFEARESTAPRDRRCRDEQSLHTRIVNVARLKTWCAVSELTPSRFRLDQPAYRFRTTGASRQSLRSTGRIRIIAPDRSRKSLGSEAPAPYDPRRER